MVEYALQIDPPEDMKVSVNRTGDGDLIGISVGDVEISTIRFAQNDGNLVAGSVDAKGEDVHFGIVAKNDGIRIRHAESYANESPGTKVKLDGINPIVDISDVDFSDPGTGAALLLPVNAPTPPLVTALVSNGEGGTFPQVNVDDDGDPNTMPVLSDAMIVSVTDEKVIGGTRYYLLVGGITTNETGRFVELPVVTEDDDITPVRDKAAGFDYMAYGVWAEIDDKDKEAALGNGYLIDNPRMMMTPVTNMPVTGTATFEGQYTSYVQKQGSTGAIRHMDGDVSMTANFGRDSMTVNLLEQFGSGKDNTLTLTGTITGNTFAGTGVKDFDDGDLQSAGATAKLDGRFYGMAVDEAGGVYDVLGGASKNPGRVVGAFGGVNTGN